jgi:predicted GH43/DUF377 family glycosyl hydrolase
MFKRFGKDPLIAPGEIRFTRATGTFNPAATMDHRTGKIVLLVRVFEESAKRSCLVLAVSSDGEHVDAILQEPALGREAPYEEWGVEDARITFLADEGRYAITYTGYSSAGPRVCLVTTDDILDPSRYVRHGPRIAGDNKNTVVFPAKIGGRYAILHRPMPRIVYAEVDRLEDPWPTDGHEILGPIPGSWRSGRVGAGAPPIRTEDGWLLAFHGARNVSEGNVYSMGLALLDLADPRKVLWTSRQPILAPEASYEIVREPVPQVDMQNFPSGIQVVFPEGLVERGDDLFLYYGAGDVFVGGAKASRTELLAAIAKARARASA